MGWWEVSGVQCLLHRHKDLEPIQSQCGSTGLPSQTQVCSYGQMGGRVSPTELWPAERAHRDENQGDPASHQVKAAHEVVL